MDQLLQITVGLIVLFLAWQFWQANCKSNLDNRPRWPMGGLRDDTGSHNAKDVFGMGFGLDQTRVGTQTADGVYNVQLGKSSRPLMGKLQTEYGNILGDPQLARFLDRKTKTNFAEPEKKSIWARIKAKANERAQLMRQKSTERKAAKEVEKAMQMIQKGVPELTKQSPAAFLDRRPTSFLDRPKKLMFASKTTPSTTEDYLASQLR